MASHYLFEPEFCNPASGWEKGQVEKNVQDARRRLWQAHGPSGPAFPDIDALNAWLEEQCIAEKARTCGVDVTCRVWRDMPHVFQLFSYRWSVADHSHRAPLRIKLPDTA